MGGCVASAMDRRNSTTLTDHDWIQNMRNYGPNSIAIAGTETKTSSATYRNGQNHSDEQFKKWCTEVSCGDNLAHRFRSVCKARGDQVALKYRAVDKVVKETVTDAKGVQKLLEITHLRPSATMTFTDFWGNIEAFSRGLVELNLPPRSTVAIYEETRWEWLATIFGIWTRDLVTSTVYANLGEDALFYALNETESKAIVCNAKNVPHLLRGVAAGAFPPCTIIYLDSLPADCAAPDSCRLVAWGDVVEMGRKAPEREIIMPKNEDLALIMYTSGTTGNPKGVMHTHGSIASGVLIMDYWIFGTIDLLPFETYCAYLPLAHILEFGVVSIFLIRGALVCFGSPRTLTDATARPHGDLTEYKPTLLIGVPRIFDTLRRVVESKLPPPGTLKRQVFDRAYQSRWAALKEGKDTPYWNDKVFLAPRSALGGRVRLMLSGGGPLSAATQEFINVVFAPMVIGWGLTETVCVGAIQIIGDMELGVAGQVLVAEELKLADADEFKHTDKPEPRGEVCLRGPFLFKGYYKQPELTKEALDDDGWFHTGDIGSIDTLGRVRLVGRIKALAKNCLGEYIALETLESIYSAHSLVLNNCICVVVHPDKNYICALLLTDKAKAMDFAAKNGISTSYPEVLQDEVFRKEAAASLSKLALSAKRKRFELIRQVCVLNDEWTPENGVLTAAMKLKRSVINQKYEKQIANLFASD